MHSLSATQGWQTSTLFLAVVVHVLVAGLHDFPLHGVSFSAVHWTHSPSLAPASALASMPASPSDAKLSLQTPLPVMCEQSALAVQGLHVPLLHKEAAGLLQSAELRHSTQVFLLVSQRGVAPPQLPLLVHCTQVFVVVLQAGVAPEHWESLVHWTQRLVVVLHAGVGEEQLALLKHPTQVYVAKLHAGVGAEQ